MRKCFFALFFGFFLVVKKRTSRSSSEAEYFVALLNAVATCFATGTHYEHGDIQVSVYDRVWLRKYGNK